MDCTGPSARPRTVVPRRAAGSRSRFPVGPRAVWDERSFGSAAVRGDDAFRRLAVADMQGVDEGPVVPRLGQDLEIDPWLVHPGPDLGLEKRFRPRLPDQCLPGRSSSSPPLVPQPSRRIPSPGPSDPGLAAAGEPYPALTPTTISTQTRALAGDLWPESTCETGLSRALRRGRVQSRLHPSQQ